MASSNYKCVYISNSAFKRLLDINNIDSETFYIIHYDDLIPGVNEPILDVFLGKNRLSAIVNLDTLPDLDLAPYLNANTIKNNISSIFSNIGEFDNIEDYKSLLTDLETTLKTSVDDLVANEPINDQSTIPTSIGQSNKLYLYFDKPTSKYKMFIFHPRLHRFIPLKLDGNVRESTGPTRPTTTITTQNLYIETAAIVTTSAVSNLNITGDTYTVDMSSMSTICYGSPRNNFIVQGKYCFWGFDQIRNFNENFDRNTWLHITYNNCNIRFYYNNTFINAKFKSFYTELSRFRFTATPTGHTEDYTYNQLLMCTKNKFLDTDNNEAEILELTKDNYASPSRPISTSSSTLGTFGLTIIAESIVAPEVEPLLFPNGYVNAKLYNTVNGKPGFTTKATFLEYNSTNNIDYYDTENIPYDSYISVKLPFNSLAEYYYAKNITEINEVEEL